MAEPAATPEEVGLLLGIPRTADRARAEALYAKAIGEARPAGKRGAGDGQAAARRAGCPLRRKVEQTRLPGVVDQRAALLVDVVWHGHQVR